MWSRVSSERKYAEAVAALTARLEAWGVEDAPMKAHEFMRDMAQQGWRAHGGFDVRPPLKGTPAAEAIRDAALETARQALARARHHEETS